MIDTVGEGRSDRAGPRADPRAGDAGQRGHLPLRPRAQRQGHADLRRSADLSPTAGARSWRAHRRGDARQGARPHRPRVAAPRRDPNGDSRRGRRDARHGLRRRHRFDTAGNTRRTTDGAVLGDDAGAHQRIGAQVPTRSRSHPDRSRRYAARHGAGSPERIHGAALAQAGGAGSHPRHRGARRRRWCSAARASRSTS